VALSDSASAKVPRLSAGEPSVDDSDLPTGRLGLLHAAQAKPRDGADATSAAASTATTRHFIARLR